MSVLRSVIVRAPGRFGLLVCFFRTLHAWEALESGRAMSDVEVRPEARSAGERELKSLPPTMLLATCANRDLPYAEVHSAWMMHHRGVSLPIPCAVTEQARAVVAERLPCFHSVIVLYVVASR